MGGCVWCEEWRWEGVHGVRREVGGRAWCEGGEVEVWVDAWY